MAKRRRVGRRAASLNWLWYPAIGTCVVAIVAILLISQRLIDGSRVNERILCPTDGPANAVAVLLDLTDPLSVTQQFRLRSFVDSLIESSGEDTMISIGVVSEDPSRWGASFAKCRPATGKDANQLYENPVLIAQRYRQEFREPVDRLLDELLQGDAESESPIMEALQSLIAGTQEFTQARGGRRAIIVSDMLQNSENLSFYRDQGWDYFVERQGERRLAESLDDVAVEIWRIPRESRIPDDLVEGFWTRYFDRQGSRPPTVRSLGDL